jgi:hypothetical protein
MGGCRIADGKCCPFGTLRGSPYPAGCLFVWAAKNNQRPLCYLQFAIFCSVLALRRFDGDLLVQMFGSDALIQAVLCIHCLKFGHLDPFFSRLFFLS